MKIRTNLKSGAGWYTVQNGDSLASIAQRFYGPNATAADTIAIYSANQAAIGVDPCTLMVGQSLWIPDRPTPTPTPPSPTPVGQCTQHWVNNQCAYQTCPYPPYQMPCS